MRHVFKILFFFLLTGCGSFNIAPSETWDNDDTRILIFHACSLEVKPDWFTTKFHSKEIDTLNYDDKFQDSICGQIHFSDDIDTNNKQPLSRKQIVGNNEYGLWYATPNGYEFQQTKPVQYPMMIEIDTLNNQIILIDKKQTVSKK